MVPGSFANKLDPSLGLVCSPYHCVPAHMSPIGEQP